MTASINSAIKGMQHKCVCLAPITNEMDFEHDVAVVVLICHMQMRQRRARIRRQLAPPVAPVPRPIMPSRVRLTLQGLTDAECQLRYRLTLPQTRSLYALLRPRLAPRTTCRHAVPGITKLLCCLRFLATGTFQHPLAELGGISQGTFSSILSRFLPAMRDMCPLYVGYPTSPEGWQRVKQGFYEHGGFPNVLGAIDCTHIAIRAPRNDAATYINRKHFHSMNVQMVCDAKLRIMSLYAAFPGSAHDSYILHNSALADEVEDGRIPEGWLIGDSGYPLKTWLMTPYRVPEGPDQEAYNHAHQTTRSAIERCFGMLKMRFRCLDRSGGALQYDPNKVALIILACAMLHNIAQGEGILEHLPLEAEPDDVPVAPQEEADDEEDARHLRQRIVRGYFTDEDAR